MVGAWATENRLVLGQVKVDKKSNEITAIPELIKVLEVSGCIVTIDAMGCQREIVKLLAEQNADYVITLKKNQGQLYKNVEQLFTEAIRTDQGILPGRLSHKRRRSRAVRDSPLLNDDGYSGACRSNP